MIKLKILTKINFTKSFNPKTLKSSFFIPKLLKISSFVLKLFKIFYFPSLNFTIFFVPKLWKKKLTLIFASKLLKKIIYKKWTF